VRCADFVSLALLLLGGLLVGSGCVHKSSSAPVSRLVAKAPAGVSAGTADPTRIRAGADALTGLDGYDADDLFQLGYEAFQREDLGLSILLYSRLIEEFSTDENVLPARYNLALSYEKEGSLDEAIDVFSGYVTASERELPQEAAETRIRVAALLQRQGRVAESKALLDLALAEPLLILPERWEAQILYAIVTADEGKFDRAEWNIKAIGRAIRKRAVNEGDRYPFQSAMLWYHVGAVFRMRAGSYKLDVIDDLPLLEERLQNKAKDLLEARQHYKRCLKHMVAAWSGPAALALGGVYEDFRRDLLAAPKPSQLDAERSVVYTELLEATTGKFLGRAASDYNEVLRDAQRYQLETAWVFAIEDALQRCETLLAELAAMTAASPEEEPPSPPATEANEVTPDLSSH
jgi:tetratricopeptide (TPR) repeat protein